MSATFDQDASASGVSRPPRDLRWAFRQALFWAVMFGAGESSFSLLAAYLHAPEIYFGLLSGLPQLFGPLAQVGAANLTDYLGKRKLLVQIAVAVQILSFAPLAVLVFAEPSPAVHAFFLFCVTLYFIAGHFSHPPWTGIIGDLAPSEHRARFFARLSRWVGGVSLVAQLGMGVALYLGREHGGLKWIFAVGMALSGIVRIGSFVCIQRIQEPPHSASRDTVFTFWQFIRRAPESNFVKFVIFVALVHFGAQISGPFFLPYWIYTLGLPEWQWVLLNGITAVSAVLTLLAWGRFSHRFGNKNTIHYCSYGIALIPLGWLFTSNIWFLGLINAWSGVLWAGFGLSTWNYMLEAVSAPKRPRCAAYFNIVVGVGIFAGSMAGSWLGKVLPLTLDFGGGSVTVKTTFMYLLGLSFLMRLAACLMLPAFKELRPNVEGFSLRRHFYTIASGRVPFGLRFVVGATDELEPPQKRSAEAEPEKTPQE